MAFSGTNWNGKHLTLWKRDMRRQPVWRGRKGKWDQARGLWVNKGLSSVISTSVACQSHHGWPCLERCYKRDPLSRLGWAELSHFVCLWASHPPLLPTYTHISQPATPPLCVPHLLHRVTKWSAAEEEEVTWKEMNQKKITFTVLYIVHLLCDCIV